MIQTDNAKVICFWDMIVTVFDDIWYGIFTGKKEEI